MTETRSFNSYTEFESSPYLEYGYSTLTENYSRLKFYHEAFKSLPNGVKVLEYGTGPVIMSTISAALNASEIVLSDHAESNCSALRQWLNGDDDAFDWTPYFNYVVKELEGENEKEVKDRQEKVRNLVKAVVHCDLTCDPPIEQSYNQLYDVVISSFVLESVAHTHDEYKICATRLGKLVKPGGVILIATVENNIGYYVVGEKRFKNVPVTADFVVKTFQSIGFCDINVFTSGIFLDGPKTFTLLKVYREI